MLSSWNWCPRCTKHSQPYSCCSRPMNSSERLTSSPQHKKCSRRNWLASTASGLHRFTLWGDRFCCKVWLCPFGTPAQLSLRICCPATASGGFWRQGCFKKKKKNVLFCANFVSWYLGNPVTHQQCCRSIFMVRIFTCCFLFQALGFTVGWDGEGDWQDDAGRLHPLRDPGSQQAFVRRLRCRRGGTFSLVVIGKVLFRWLWLYKGGIEDLLGTWYRLCPALTTRRLCEGSKEWFVCFFTS